MGNAQSDGQANKAAVVWTLVSGCEPTRLAGALVTFKNKLTQPSERGALG
jgi:hypothetical protein